MPAKLKKNKPEYLYIKGKDLGTYKDDEKTIKVIAENTKMLRDLKKITMLNLSIFT